MLALLMATAVDAQIKISGTVLDESDLPVQHAALRVKGESGSTFTNANGEFALTMQDENATVTTRFAAHHHRSPAS